MSDIFVAADKEALIHQFGTGYPLGAINNLMIDMGNGRTPWSDANA